MSGTALVPAPVVKAPVIQTSVNFAFNTDDMVHLAVEKKVAALEKELRELNKQIDITNKSIQKDTKDIQNKLENEKNRIFETEFGHLKAVFPKIKFYVRDYGKKLYIEYAGHTKTKLKSSRYNELATELKDLQKPLQALYEKRGKLSQAMNRTTLTSKYKAKLARIKLNELKSQGVDLLGLVDLD